MAPPQPLLIPPPGNVPGLVPAFPDGAPFRRGSDMRLVGGPTTRWFDSD